MHRRGIGVAAIKNKSLAQRSQNSKIPSSLHCNYSKRQHKKMASDRIPKGITLIAAVMARFKDKSSEIAENQMVQMAKQMEMFKVNLEDFAGKHKDDIRKDPAFRVQFQEMCASIGVDPLASSKGFWAEMLGVGDFYYELGVQIIEVCIATSHRNGGLIGIEELRDRLVASRGKKSQDISIDDLLRAIKKLKVLGNGFTVVPVGGTHLVQSVPGELSMDHTKLLQEAQGSGFITKSKLMKDLKWEEERAVRALNYMIKEGLAWVDDQSNGERQFWFPSFFPDVSPSS